MGVREVNGWDIAYRDWGYYSKNYLQRAAVALEQLATNDNVQAMYASDRVDDVGEPLNGSKKYVVRFEAGRTPPVNSF